MQKPLSVRQMADRLGVSAKTLKKHAVPDGIPHFYIGRNMRFRPEEVEAHLAAKAAEPRETARIRTYPVKSKSRPRKNVISVKFAQA